MEKWAIRPDPAPHDPKRHVLLLKGTMTDVSAILRKFGAMCGRPTELAVTAEGYNYRLALHAVTPSGLEKLGQALNGMAPGGGTASATLPPPPAVEPPAFAPLSPAPAPSGLDAPLPSLPSLGEPAPGGLGGVPDAPGLPSLGAPDAPGLPSLGGLETPGLPSMPALGGLPAAGSAPGLAPVEPALPPPPPVPTPEPTPAPAPMLQPVELTAPPPVPVPTPPPSLEAPPPVPMPTPPPAEPPPATVLQPVAAAPETFPPAGAPTPAPPPPAAATPPPLSAPAAEPAPLAAPAPVIAPGVLQQAAPAPARPVWGLHQALDAGHSFETLLVGAYNRFAHAAATSVVSAPGTMYNPLFLYGAPGAGKTHVAQSIARALGQALGDENVLSTSGSRLSSAVSHALAENRYKELDEVLQKAKALVVDDIHLLAVTEANRQTLAQVFAIFFSKNLQVVLTSIYPPRALGALEEALKISFGKGWSVDVKIPNPNVQAEIVRSQLDRLAIQLSTDEGKRFLELLGPNYFESIRWARRLKRFVRQGQAVGRNPAPPDLFPVLFDPGVKQPHEEMPTAAELQSIAAFKPPAPKPDAKNIAFMVPKGGEALAPWVLARFFQTGGELGITQSYRPVLVEAYDAQQPFGVPFQIGELCARSNAQAAVVIGPPPDTQLAQREQEFSHAVNRILEGLDVPMGWLKFKGTTALPNYLRVHLDLLRGLD